MNSTSFNRYMVECEFTVIIIVINRLVFLIDTWWNVNLVSTMVQLQHSLVLIDTWWNVNLTYQKNI